MWMGGGRDRAELNRHIHRGVGVVDPLAEVSRGSLELCLEGRVDLSRQRA
jgi:hypothetical protein